MDKDRRIAQLEAQVARLLDQQQAGVSYDFTQMLKLQKHTKHAELNNQAARERWAWAQTRLDQIRDDYPTKISAYRAIAVEMVDRFHMKNPPSDRQLVRKLQ